MSAFHTTLNTVPRHLIVPVAVPIHEAEYVVKRSLALMDTPVVHKDSPPPKFIWFIDVLGESIVDNTVVIVLAYFPACSNIIFVTGTRRLLDLVQWLCQLFRAIHLGGNSQRNT